MRSLLVAVLALTACLDAPPPGAPRPPTENPDPDPLPEPEPEPDPDPQPTGPTTATAFIHAYDAAFCAVAFSCQTTYAGDQPFSSMFGASPAECATILDGQIDIVNIERDVGEARITFNHAAAETCLAGLVPNQCSGFWQGATIQSACNDVLRGQIADGDPCRITEDCLNADSTCDPIAAVCRN